MFFKVFSFHERSRQDRRRVAFSPSQELKKQLKIDQYSFPNYQKNSFENTIDFLSIFGPKMHSK